VRARRARVPAGPRGGLEADRAASPRGGPPGAGARGHAAQARAWDTEVRTRDRRRSREGAALIRELPPKPGEVAERVVGDTAARVRFCVELLATRIAAKLQHDDHWNLLIRGEELGEEEVDALWDERNLGPTYAHALAEVKAAYLDQAALIDDVVDDLARAGPESWIALALRHYLASVATWDALDRLGELERVPEEALCATCGAALGDGTAVDGV
jgi:hypothetical protein